MAFQVSGIITESFINTTWICKTYDYFSGVLLNTVTTTTNTFEIPSVDESPVTVVVSPVLSKRWVTGATVLVDDTYYPSNPKLTPYYFKCITTGSTDTVEPSWNIGAGAITNDGGVVWEMVEDIINPVIHAPIIPTVIT